MGMILYNIGRVDEAIDAYHQAITIKPDLYTAWYNLGNALYRLQRYEEAVEAQRQAAVLAPNDHQIWSNLGAALVQAKRFQEAVASYRRAVALQPNHGETLANLGAALRKLGQVDEVFDVFDRASQIMRGKRLLTAQLVPPDTLAGWTPVVAECRLIDAPAESCVPAPLQCLPTYLLELREAQVTANFLPLTAEGQIPRYGCSHCQLVELPDTAYSVYSEIVQIRDATAFLMPPAAIRRIDQRCALFFGGNQTDYTHWLIDYLGRLAVLSRFDDITRMPLLVGETLSDVQRAALARLGVPDGNLIYKRRDEYLHCRHLLAPSFASRTGIVYPEVVEFLRGNLAKGVAPSLCKRLYVSRRDTARRKLVNEAEIEAYLAARGFSVILLGEMTLEQQISALAGAEVVVSATGSGLVNCAFCPPGARMVEIITKPHAMPACLAAVGRLDYAAVVAQPVATTRPAAREDSTTYTVPLEQLAACLGPA